MPVKRAKPPVVEPIYQIWPRPWPGDPGPDILSRLHIDDYRRFAELEIGLREKQAQIEIERLANQKALIKKLGAIK